MAEPKTPSTNKASAWTTEEKYDFLVRIISQITGENKISIDFKKLGMTNRTEKSLSLMWYKIRDEAKAFRENGEIQPAAPASRKGGKRKTTAPDGDDGPDGSTPTKKARRVNKKTPTKAKAEPVDLESPVKEESTEEEAYTPRNNDFVMDDGSGEV